MGSPPAQRSATLWYETASAARLSELATLLAAYRLSESEYRRGYDIVVVARSRAAVATYQEIADCLRKQSERLGLIRKEDPSETHPAVDDPVLPETHLPS